MTYKLTNTVTGEEIFSCEIPSYILDKRRWAHHAVSKLTHTPGSFSHKKVNHVDFTDSDLSGLSLLNIDFTGCNFTNCSFEHTDLRHTILTGCNFNGATFARVDFSCADLAGANFKGAFIDNIKLSGQPLLIDTPEYGICIFEKYMQIGCQLHTIEEWERFNNRQIMAMDGLNATRWWHTHRDKLLAQAKEYLG